MEGTEEEAESAQYQEIGKEQVKEEIGKLSRCWSNISRNIKIYGNTGSAPSLGLRSYKYVLSIAILMCNLYM